MTRIYNPRSKDYTYLSYKYLLFLIFSKLQETSLINLTFPCLLSEHKSHLKKNQYFTGHPNPSKHNTLKTKQILQDP